MPKIYVGGADEVALALLSEGDEIAAHERYQ